MAGERATVLAEDHAQALALVTDWEERHYGAHTTGGALELVGMIAAAIADGRDRTLAPVSGPVRLVDSVVNVDRRYWTTELRPWHEAAVRKAWAERLQLDGLRPLTWPAIVVAHLGYQGAPFPLQVPEARCADRWRQLPPEHPDVEVVRLTISGDAVAAQ